MLRGFCLWVCCWAFAAQADTVWLKNGDKLSGNIELLDSGILLLKTSYAGTLRIKVEQIATLESDQPLLVRHNAWLSEHTQALKPANEGQVELVNGATSLVQLSAIERMLPPKPVVQDLALSGEVSLSADYKRAQNQIEDYDLDLAMQAKHGALRHGFDLQYSHETKDQQRKTNNVQSGYNLDYFFSPKFFVQGQLQYRNDQLEDLHIQRSVGAGPGYQFWDDALGAFSLVGLINRNDYAFRSGSSVMFNSMALEWDYRRRLLGQSLELFSAGEIGVPQVGQVSYTFDTEAGLRYRFNDWASLTLKAEWDRVLSEYGDLNERRLLVGFGIGW